MPEDDPDLANCQACGALMDVSAVGPFTNVECPACKEHTRVKLDFGSYQLKRRYAIGGMSVVFLAEDPTLGREVIVKILNEDYSANDVRIAAFEEEARITASISHPNVVRVLTTGTAYGRFFIAMEFVPGGHFEGHIRKRGKIPENEALPLAIEVVEGLSAAHEANLIHRDIKPGNILLDAQGHAKIVDFGLALVTKDGKAKVTELWATPYYVPPETIEGKDEDFRSDLYAFGASFYHALAGVPPCDVETMDTARLREAKKRIRPLRQAAPEISEATAAVIDRCMAYVPEDRFESYEQLLAALRHAERPPAEDAQPASSRGEKRFALPVLVTLLVIAAVLTVFLQQKPAPVVVQEVEELETSAPESALGGQVATLYRDAHTAMEIGDFSRAMELFSQVRDDPGVLEPSGSVAGCEAVIAAFAAGDHAAARREAKAALDHLEVAADLRNDLKDEFAAALETVGQLDPVPVPESLSQSRIAPVIHQLAALKNWEHGFAREARPFFLAVAKTDSRESWVRTHVALAERYLAESKRLKEAEPADFALAPEAKAEKLRQLESFAASLETRGRAPFIVGAWIARLQRTPAPGPPEPEPQPEPQPSADDEALAAIEADLKAARFPAALESLGTWQPADEAAATRRETLLEMAQTAQDFLDGLASRGTEGLAGLTLRTASGLSFTGIKSGSGPEPTLTAPGAEKTVAWPEVNPADLIEAHRALTRAEADPSELLRRHDQALVFQWLAGDRALAEEAAARLGEANEPFRLRWQKRMIALQPAAAPR